VNVGSGEGHLLINLRTLFERLRKTAMEYVTTKTYSVKNHPYSFITRLAACWDQVVVEIY